MSSAFGEIGIDDLTKILSAIETSNLVEVEVTFGELRIHVRKDGVVSGFSQLALPVPLDGARPQTAAPVDSAAARRIEVKAPMLGMFYRSPTPGTAPFVEVGQLVEVNDPIGLLEVMKLFNQVSAGFAGRIVAILAEDGALVEHGQIIAVIEVAE